MQWYQLDISRLGTKNQRQIFRWAINSFVSIFANNLEYGKKKNSEVNNEF